MMMRLQDLKREVTPAWRLLRELPVGTPFRVSGDPSRRIWIVRGSSLGTITVEPATREATREKVFVTRDGEEVRIRSVKAERTTFAPSTQVVEVER